MRCAFLVLGLALASHVAAQTASAPAATAPKADAGTRAIDALVAEASKREELPGVSIAVLRGGRVLLARGYGLADLAAETQASATTVYPIGSISKQFTAAGILFLAERGRLQVNDPVGRFWPQLGQRHPQVTIEHLLRHTAGLREVVTLPEFEAATSAPGVNGDRLLGIAAAAPAGFAPGSRWAYSNTNYQVLARLIEAINGEPYDRFLTEVLFKHVGLTSLHACANEPAPDEATGYLLRGRVLEPAARANMDLARGDNGLCGNAVDLARWARALLRSDVLAPASRAAMVGRTQLADGSAVAYGMGLALLPLEGRRRISHNGAIGGYSGTLAYYPDDDLSIAVLTNRAGATTEALEKAIARSVLKLQAPRTASLATPPELVQRLLGPWDIGVAGLAVQVEERGDRLWLSVPPPGVSGPLQFQGGDRFVVVADAVEVRLVKGTDGADRLQLTMAGLPWSGQRGAPPPAAPTPPPVATEPATAPMSATAPPAAAPAPAATAPAHAAGQHAAELAWRRSHAGAATAAAATMTSSPDVSPGRPRTS